MNTTLYRSLALLISMFALTSSFSLSTHIHISDNESSDDNVSDNKEDAWIVDVVDSKNTDISTRHLVKKGNKPGQEEQNPSAFFDEVMKYKDIGNLISKELKGKFDSIFRVSRSNYKNVTIGVISEDCTLHLFNSIYRLPSLFSYEEYLLDKIDNTFFAKEMEEDKDGNLKLYFNGQGKKTIEVETVKVRIRRIIRSYVSSLVNKTHTTNKDNKKAAISKNNRWDMNSHILFWGSIFAFAAIYVIYKYWWFPRKKSL